MNYTEVYGNLFDVKSHYVFAHCISDDLALGAGIAKQFRQNYPKMVPTIAVDHVYRKSNIRPYVDPKTGRKIYNLVTKKKFYNKPTRNNFNKSLISLKQEMIKNDEKFLAIPLIGAGLDKLDWSESSKYIQELFSDTDINIVVIKYRRNV